MATKKRSLPVRQIDARVLLGDIAVDASNTYVTGFAHEKSHRLVAIAHGATAPHLVISAREAPALSLLACDDSLLVASTDRRVVRIDTRTGAITTLVETPVAMTTALALDHESIYGTIIGADGGVFRAPRSGGALEWLHRGRATSLAVSRGRIAFSDGAHLWLKDSTASEARRLCDSANPHSIAFVGDELIWTEFAPEGSLRAFDIARGDQRVIASAPYSSALVALGGHLYWAQASSRKTLPWIWRARRDTPSSIEPLVRGTCKRARIAGHGATLSWCGGGDGGAFSLDVTALATPA